MPGSEFVNTAVLLGAFGVLLAFSALFSRTMERFGVPVVLLFLVLGMLAGSEGIGRIPFDDYRFAFRVGTAALVLILLEGGLSTSAAAVRRSFAPAMILATFGVAGTAILVALGGRLFGLDWATALLLGAVVSSTDVAAVFAVLRGGRLNLAPRVATTLEVESGANDPMAVILTTLVTAWTLGKAGSVWSAILGVPLQLGLGLLVGLLVGWVTRRVLLRIRVPAAGFLPVLTVAAGFIAFGLATLIQGSGFLAVYVAGIALGNGALPYRAGLYHVHHALGWLSQIAVFLMLGLLVFPSQLWRVAGMGLALALALTFVIRPLVVALCLLPLRFPAREVVYLGCVGLRGAVPIILAVFPLLSGVPNALEVFNVVFFFVVVNAVIPGAGIRWLTRKLGLQVPETPQPAAALEISSTRMLQGELLSFFVTDVLAVCGARLAEVVFPAGATVILLVRGDELIAPRGNTLLEPQDHVYVFCQPEDRAYVELLFGRPLEGGLGGSQAQGATESADGRASSSKAIDRIDHQTDTN